MKTTKHIIVVLLIVLTSVLIGFYIEYEGPIVLIIAFTIVLIFIFNLTIRKSLRHKKYFTSRYNLFTTKIHIEKRFDLSKDLMFEKIIEVINDSTFKLVETDKNSLEILAISTISFSSWGENLYIIFESNENEVVMKFCSVTLFQMYSWGKNEKNYEYLLNEIEHSLTV